MAQKRYLAGSPYFVEDVLGINMCRRAKDGRLTHLLLNQPPVCDSRCRRCFMPGDRRNRRTNALSLAESCRLLSDAREEGMLCLEISGEGEPLLSPHIREIVHCAYSNGFVTTLITNGHALAPELTEFLFNHDVTLVVSLFSLDQCLYESDNGLPGSFIPTLRNICRAAEVYKFGTKSDADRQIFRMAIHTTVQVDNVDHLADIRAFCDTWGIFLSVAPLALVGGGAKHPHLLAEGEGASKAMEIGDNSIILSATSLEEMGRQVCGTCMYGLNVGFDGNVLFDAHAGYEVGSSLGNVRSHDIKELVRRQRMCARFLFSSIDGFCPVRDRKWPDFLRRWQAAVSKGLDLGSINDIAHQSVANASWHAGSLPLCRSCLS